MSLKRFLCDQIPTPNRATLLSEEEARHAIKVYRLQQGDRVEVLDGQGHAVIASLRLNSKGSGSITLNLLPSSRNQFLHPTHE